MIDEDIKKGNKALISRGINGRKGLSSLSIFGEWIGGFFLKSSNHSDMVFNAMKSRGFQGEARNNKFNNKELILKSSMLALFLLAILVIDRKV
jgi:cobalt/nickel transport system permease protein